MLDRSDVWGAYAAPLPARPLVALVCLPSPPTATVLHARTQRPHRGPDTSAGTRAAVSTPHASHPPRGGTGVEAMTDGLLGLRAEPQHGVPIQLLPPVPGPQRDSAPRPVLRWHSWEPLLIWVTRANVEIILTIPSSPAPARAPRAGARACIAPPATRSGRRGERTWAWAGPGRRFLQHGAPRPQRHAGMPCVASPLCHWCAVCDSYPSPPVLRSRPPLCVVLGITRGEV